MATEDPERQTRRPLVDPRPPERKPTAVGRLNFVCARSFQGGGGAAGAHSPLGRRRCLVELSFGQREPAGGGMPRSVQIFRASPKSISRWRSTAVERSASKPQKL